MFSRKSKHVLFGLVAVVALLATFFMQQNPPAYIASSQGSVKGVETNLAQSREVIEAPTCLDVMTNGYNPDTGECREFPNSCLPDGWTRGCPIETNLTPVVIEATSPPENTIAPVGCPRKPEGDANCDQVINDADYDLWKTAFKSTGISDRSDYLKSDFNNDSKVDLVDFEIWRQNRFKTTVNPTCIPRPGCLDARPACTIPEPAEGWCPATTPVVTVAPTCIPRPACLDASPPCLIKLAPGATLCPGPTTRPTIAPTCIPRPSCMNDPIPCAPDLPDGATLCPAPTVTSTGPRPTSPTCNGGTACPSGWTCNTSTFICQQGGPTATPTPAVAIPSCSDCGYLDFKQSIGACSGVSCIGTQSCQAVKITCNKATGSNPNCYQARCVNTGDL
jgi:hypothetical protein